MRFARIVLLLVPLVLAMAEDGWRRFLPRETNSLAEVFALLQAELGEPDWLPGVSVEPPHGPLPPDVVRYARNAFCTPALVAGLGEQRGLTLDEAAAAELILLLYSRHKAGGALRHQEILFAIDRPFRPVTSGNGRPARGSEAPVAIVGPIPQGGPDRPSPISELDVPIEEFSREP